MGLLPAVDGAALNVLSRAVRVRWREREQRVCDRLARSHVWTFSWTFRGVGSEVCPAVTAQTALVGRTNPLLSVFTGDDAAPSLQVKGALCVSSCRFVAPHTAAALPTGAQEPKRSEGWSQR